MMCQGFNLQPTGLRADTNTRAGHQTTKIIIIFLIVASFMQKPMSHHRKKQLHIKCKVIVKQ